MMLVVEIAELDVHPDMTGTRFIIKLLAKE